jgi:hypothetical protein
MQGHARTTVQPLNGLFFLLCLHTSIHEHVPYITFCPRTLMPLPFFALVLVSNSRRRALINLNTDPC